MGLPPVPEDLTHVVIVKTSPATGKKRWERGLGPHHFHHKDNPSNLEEEGFRAHEIAPIENLSATIKHKMQYLSEKDGSAPGLKNHLQDEQLPKQSEIHKS